jgi:hypothetical protein
VLDGANRQGKDSDGPTIAKNAMLESGAGWLARRDVLPTAMRAVFGYYAHSGVFDYGSLRLKGRVDDTVDDMIATAFTDVEEAIAEAFDRNAVDFEYDTKLVLPARLTLGNCYRTLDERRHRDAEQLTRLAVEALIDGDMRDAINDSEFDDFAVDFATDSGDRRQIAEIAQEVLQARVESHFADYPDRVRDIYDWAVDISERHQDEDERFRALMERARAGEDGALSAIRTEYRDATFADPPEIFTAEELDLPYLKTQYDRVGVIYDGMVRMYKQADLPVDDAFHRAIVLAIIGAQVWLDDIDDYDADVREGQLTPVTAEYLLSDDDHAAARSVVDISERYFDRARTQATEADSPLTGIATEYIYHDGSPGVLPGWN